jgi:hypothetical protein
MNLYNRMLEFSFDILSAIVEEYKRYPEAEFDELTSDMNFSVYGSNSPNRLFVEKVIESDTKEEMIITSKNKRVDDPLDTGSDFYLRFKNKDTSDDDDDFGFYLGVDELSEISDTHLVFAAGDYFVICRKLPPASLSKRSLLS